MRRRYVALLRAISNVPMKPFVERMEELGFTDVESYGTSGNLLFNADGSGGTTLERRIAARLGATAFVRTRSELARIVGQDPYASIILFLAHAPARAKRKAFLELDFEEHPPVLRGKTVFYVYPVRVRGRRSPLDLERALGVQGTFRSARVVGRLLERMSEAKPVTRSR